MRVHGRLPRTVKGDFTKRRLDLVTEKNEMIKDIIQVGGEGELDSLSQEVCEFGEPLSEVLPRLSLPRIRRVHNRLVVGNLNIPLVYEF